ncbi:MAG: ABC transporter permease, partial [Bryobacterales bacterium]|nr:ABC transporter permease [Bryobacterales bacterium]
MSLLRRLVNVFRGERLDREIDEELQSHIEEAIENGRDPDEARRAFGSQLQTREASHDIQILSWLDSLRADLIFGWRQIQKARTASVAAILSLALAIGACSAAFRLIDALLLRPLPVADAGSLYILSYQVKDRDGTTGTGESFDYPSFRALRESVRGSAELMAISYGGRHDITFGSDQEMEKAHRQLVSGWTMTTFGLKPALGRLLTADDDVTPGAHPYAVISYDYWMRRFGGDEGVVGRSFRMGNDLYEIVGVTEKGFTGTEPGSMTDLFIPTMMNTKAIEQANWSWFRTWVKVRSEAETEQVRLKLMATLLASRREQVKSWGPGFPRDRMDEYLNAPVFLESAAAGVSGMQKNYRRAITILGILVALVLLIACANVANLMTAQSTSRAREMALRVSIGAGRTRLVQLVLMESVIIALIASVAGCFFAWWAAPFVVSLISTPDNPARFVMPADWRFFGFVVVLAVAVTFLFGLAPALRASSVQPVAALKGGIDPHARRRLMNGMIAAQVAFCFLVHFVAGLFVSTFDRLSKEPTGFSAERLLVLDVATKAAQQPAAWDQVIDRVRQVTGVESVALCDWAPLSGSSSSSPVWANGIGPEDGGDPYFLGVSPQ